MLYRTCTRFVELFKQYWSYSKYRVKLVLFEYKHPIYITINTKTSYKHESILDTQNITN